ncbi:LamG-like jellyroll fold domain-containing protein [Paenibacillus sp. GCM10023252]|uniref:LamG-like jellyroll fold domain-containing protein n=1 Tax=Paenibacillus sp. GCM10023252 TaxID=3252649 RepID=UPI0036080A7A
MGNIKMDIMTSHPALVSFWDFQEEAGQARKDYGPYGYALLEGSGGPVAREEDGVFGDYSARIEEGKWFHIPRASCPALNLSGPNARLTVAAWVKRGHKSNTQCEFLAGMWNETGAKRQYGLFLNLWIWDSGEQVCGHISSTGGPTEGHPWCMDASIGETRVPREEWQFVAITYDGRYVRSYLNGVLDQREIRNPYEYPGGIYEGGVDGADFTVAAVDRLGEIGNFYVGSLGGLAVYEEALAEEELLALAQATAT